MIKVEINIWFKVWNKVWNIEQNNIFVLLLFLLLCVCVCVLCVCVCVCVCVFIFFHREIFLRLQDLWNIRERYGWMFLCCEYLSGYFCQVPSSPYLKMSYFTSEGEFLAHWTTREKTIWYKSSLQRDDICWYRI